MPSTQDFAVATLAVTVAAAAQPLTGSYLPSAAAVALFAAYAVARTIGVDASAVPVLSKTEWKEFSLKEKIVISHNTAIYRFALPTPESVLGLPIGQHISVSAEINGKEITRSYTPTSNDAEKGHFDLLIKSYPTGNISKLFSQLEIGQTIRVRGPKGQFKYTPNTLREIGMIAGGTGITPMLQIIKAVLNNPLDRTKLSLLFANVAVEDILLRDELETLAERHPGRFTLYHVLNNPPTGWTGGVGFVSKDMISERLPAPAEDIKILLCGPPPMIKAMTNITDELGYPKSNTISKMADVVFKF
ncbi:NADH-cytochrome b5 reductase [Geranomyces variabilis]|uniref:NADH-cytochrome b5 reductase n=1 Tax=Geranomyces variabilis TaxID=109894 RepID=A0AAD5TBM6_9FUNG|nr:NADH-cytochrome b5 reductase [Geranomyces variabilis]